MSTISSMVAFGTGLNPMDWVMTADDQAGSGFGLSLPCGFGTDYAGVVDQVGDGAHHTPDGLDGLTAATLDIAARTAAAALAVISPGPGVGKVIRLPPQSWAPNRSPTATAWPGECATSAPAHRRLTGPHYG